MNNPRQPRVVALPKSTIHGKRLQDNMFMSPHLARSINQHKRPYPKYSRHKTFRISNYPTDHLEKFTEKVHYERSSLPSRDSAQPSFNHTMGKTHMSCTATRHFHLTEVQSKRFVFRWKTQAPNRPPSVQKH